jgi:hypothetical protein
MTRVARLYYDVGLKQPEIGERDEREEGVPRSPPTIPARLASAISPFGTTRRAAARALVSLANGERQRELTAPFRRCDLASSRLATGSSVTRMLMIPVERAPAIASVLRVPPATAITRGMRAS